MLFKEKKLKFIVLVAISGTVNFKQGLHGVCWHSSLWPFSQPSRKFWRTIIPVNDYFVFSIRKKRISRKMNDNTSCGYRRCDSVDLRRSLESVMEPKVAA